MKINALERQLECKIEEAVFLQLADELAKEEE